VAGIASLRAATPWDPRFVERSAWLAPLASAAALVADLDRWPTVEELDARLGPLAGVRFAAATPRPRTRAARRRPLARSELYDAQIVETGTVPTRARSWHDLLNALVWATWPRAKAALHRRQHRIVTDELAANAARLPAARTREGDTIAMLDEGGVLVARGAPLLFGHALAEGLVVAPGHLVGRTIPVDADPHDRAAVDAAFAALLADETRLHDPAELGRISVEIEPCATRSI
jgi:hypothetical protein